MIVLCCGLFFIVCYHYSFNISPFLSHLISALSVFFVIFHFSCFFFLFYSSIVIFYSTMIFMFSCSFLSVSYPFGPGCGGGQLRTSGCRRLCLSLGDFPSLPNLAGRGSVAKGLADHSATPPHPKFFYPGTLFLAFRTRKTSF